MRVLVTNDDGVDARGIRVLARRLLAEGHDVTVVAPMHQQSGSSAGIGGELNGRFVASEIRELPDLARARVIAIDAPPAAAILASHLGLAERPDIVVSGINHGHNVGLLALHSGTLGAAVTAARYGIPALAVSCSSPPTGRFEDAALLICGLLETIADRLEIGHVLNFNYPDLPLSEVRGIRRADVEAPDPGDVRLETGDGGFRMWLERRSDGLPDLADARIIADGFVSVAHLNGGFGPVEDSGSLFERLDRSLAESMAVRAEFRPAANGSDAQIAIP